MSFLYLDKEIKCDKNFKQFSRNKRLILVERSISDNENIILKEKKVDYMITEKMYWPQDK